MRTQPNILIVDDEALNIKLISAILSKESYRIAGVSDGRQALEAVSRVKPDLILLDLMMPGLDGFEVCRRLRQKEDGKAIPVVMVTALKKSDYITRAMEAGADDFITKPVDGNELLLRVKSLLRIKSYHNKMMNRCDDLARINRELKFTQAQLIQSAKLASIGELAAGVAHELNQPLMVIRGQAQLVRRSRQRGRVLANEDKCLESIERNTKRMIMIINHLRTFSRQSNSEFCPVDVHQAIENSFLMVNEQLRLRNIATRINMGAHNHRIKGDMNQMEQVVLNLVTNSRDAILALNGNARKMGPNGNCGTIKIATRDLKNKLELTVSDTGVGVPPEAGDRLFDPFFTTKEVGKGTGLGLSISYGIINSFKGSIELTESGSEGTTFKIILPTLKPN